MIQKLSVVHSIVIGIIAGFLLLYSTDFFGLEERIRAENSSYIEGATPSDISEWEMY